MRRMRILILERSERTLVLPSGRTVGLMRSMRILILERSERSVALMRSMRMKFSSEARGSNLFDKLNKKSTRG